MDQIPFLQCKINLLLFSYERCLYYFYDITPLTNLQHLLNFKHFSFDYLTYNYSFLMKFDYLVSIMIKASVIRNEY